MALDLVIADAEPAQVPACLGHPLTELSLRPALMLERAVRAIRAATLDAPGEMPDQDGQHDSHYDDQGQRDPGRVWIRDQHVGGRRGWVMAGCWHASDAGR